MIQLDNESAAKKALEKVKERVDDQKSAFESYVPAEVPKLEKAVTAQYGDCVVLSVSDSPEEAQKLIEQHLK